MVWGAGTSNSSQKPCLAFPLASAGPLSCRTRFSMLAAVILVAFRDWPGERCVHPWQGPADPRGRPHTVLLRPPCPSST